MKIHLPSCLLLTFVPLLLDAQAIATWNFDGTGTTLTEVATVPATSKSPAFTAAGLSRGSGLVAENAQDGVGAKDWDPENTTAAAAMDDNEHYIIQLNIGAGNNVSITSLQFQMYRGNNQGPEYAELRSSIDGYATTLGGVVTPVTGTPPTLYTFTLPSSGYSNLTGTVFFRVVGYGANNVSSGTLVFGNTPGNDIIINGTAVLPVELAGFHARRQNDAVVLDWETKTETNCDYFAIERSADGRVYEELDRAPGAGNSVLPRQYRWTDTDPLPGRNYYRLRQTDFDGTYDYSPAVSALLPGAGAHLRSTLVSEQLLLEFGRPSPEPLGWRVIDVLGRVVSEGVLEPEREEQTLSASALAEGMYWLHLASGEVLKFYKKG